MATKVVIVHEQDGARGSAEWDMEELNEEGRLLLQWWIDTTVSDFRKTVPKMLEYGGGMEGSADLVVMGDAQAKLLGWDDVPSAIAQELACWFYSLGKISRLISDYRHRRKGKADTWFDLRIYSMMAKRIQEFGRWP